MAAALAANAARAQQPTADHPTYASDAGLPQAQDASRTVVDFFRRNLR